MDSEINAILAKQRAYFATGQTLPLDFRIQQLNKLKKLVLDNRDAIIDALEKDLKRQKTETFLEIYMMVQEIDLIVKNLKKWAKPTPVRTPFFLHWPGKSRVHYEPYGSALIIGPWNGPLLLVMSPLVGAISAGNCAIVKPSEISVNAENLICEIINNNFPPEYIVAVKANAERTKEILKEKFDYIFFTGSTRVGKKVLAAAAANLTPVTLEMGGKNPCIIDETADVAFAARKITAAKFLNAGQVCVAPDFVLIHSSRKQEFIDRMRESIEKFYPNLNTEKIGFGKIIDRHNYDRLITMLDDSNVVYGGKIYPEVLTITPTIVDEVDFSHPLMQEEIFGPILPVITYDNLEDVIAKLSTYPKPLALYLFSKNAENQKIVEQRISYGCGSINDCVAQIFNLNLPFGGVGFSGMGKYHGKYSFETFSNKKGIYERKLLLDFDFQYPPYDDSQISLLEKIFRWARVFW